jgi:hypothetical protein
MNERWYRKLLLTAATAVLACGMAAAQYDSGGYESPTYVGSPEGTILTGQDGYYIPADTDSVDWYCYTYAGNVVGIVPHPTDGGEQFVAGEGPGDGTFYARAQRDMPWGPYVWHITYDIAARYMAAATPQNNVGSFSVQPYPGSASYIHLFSWNEDGFVTCAGDIDGDGDTDHSDLGALLAAWCTHAGDPNWNANADLDGDGHVGHGDLGILLADWNCAPVYPWQAFYLAYDADGTAHAQPGMSPGSEWENLILNHWYRFTTSIDFSSNMIVEVGITDLHTGQSTVRDVTAEGWYLEGGQAGGSPEPTGFRLFGGGGSPDGQNLVACDNLAIFAE